MDGGRQTTTASAEAASQLSPVGDRLDWPAIGFGALGAAGLAAAAGEFIATGSQLGAADVLLVGIALALVGLAGQRVRSAYARSSKLPRRAGAPECGTAGSPGSSAPPQQASARGARTDAILKSPEPAPGLPGGPATSSEGQPGAADVPLVLSDFSGRALFASTAFIALARDLGCPQARTVFDLPFSEVDASRLYTLARGLAAGSRSTAEMASARNRDGTALVRPNTDGTPLLAITVNRASTGDGRPAIAWWLTPADTKPPADPADTATPDSAARTFAAALVAASPGAVAAIATDGVILAASDAFQRLLRLPGEASQTPDRDAPAAFGTIDTLFDGEDDRSASGLLGPVAAGTRSRFDGDLPEKGGENRLFRLAVRPLDGFGDPRIAILSVSDVTEQSALEAQFAQGQKLQAIGQLAGGVADDFNNVLTAIIGFSDLLLQSHRPSDPSFRDIMNIRQSAQRAAGLVRQLLAFSRRQTLRPARLDLNDLVADLSVMLDRLLGERVTLTIEHGRDLWRVMADVSQLEQVVINLAVNARDAMPGGGTLTIRTANVTAGDVGERDLEGTLSGDAVAIEIVDTGTGIGPDILDKIFEPFFTTKEIGEGTGLGLSTVYGIVKQTGGTLLVDTRPGEGSTFTVLLPRASEAPETAERVPDGAQRADGPAGRDAGARRQDLTGSATVLLVEDEEAIRMFASRALSNKGYRVLTAAHGLDALDVLAEEAGAVDLLVSDVIMPEMDGPALVAEVEARYPDVRIMLMSGYADATQAGALEARRDIRFIPKPFTLKGLAEAVKAALGD